MIFTKFMPFHLGLNILTHWPVLQVAFKPLFHATQDKPWLRAFNILHLAMVLIILVFGYFMTGVTSLEFNLLKWVSYYIRYLCTLLLEVGGGIRIMVSPFPPLLPSVDGIWSAGVGVTKAPSVNFSVSKIFDLAKLPLRLFESRLYLTGATAAELRRHLSNIKKWYSIANVCFDNTEKFGK